MTSALRRRLLLLLLAPLLLLAGLNTWFDFRSADGAALQQDRQLLNLVPLLADSIVARGATEADPPAFLTAPPVDAFLSDRPGMAAYAVLSLDGNVVLGDAWLSGPLPTTREPEFSSEEFGGLTYRIASQRVKTVAGEVIVRLADGSDTRQQWLHRLWLKVVLPNLVLVIAAFFSVNWAVDRALRPLIELKEAVARRSPRDLTALDPEATPDEVRPLVHSLNRLFDLVNAQAESQRRFVADAAHQLRTPLAGLQSQVEAWAQTVNHGGQTDWRDRASAPTDPSLVQAESQITLSGAQVNKLRGATRRTSLLANQLLALSRADARNPQAEPMQRVDLKQLCEVMLENHLDAAAAKNIDLGLDCEAVHAHGHEWLLRELMGNLIDNAIKYTPVGGRVSVCCGLAGATPDSAHPFLAVEDDGPGVPEHERLRILERFYRVPGTQAEGNGLGLAIAEEIARVHQSILRVDSGSAGRGLRVSLWLPD